MYFVTYIMESELLRLLVLAAVVVAAPQAEDGEGEEVTRLQLVTLRGDECRAGSCHTAAECGAAGGEEGGSCAGGFGMWIQRTEVLEIGREKKRIRN